MLHNLYTLSEVMETIPPKLYEYREWLTRQPKHRSSNFSQGVV